MPVAESLALTFNEESQEERELRRSLGLHTEHDETQWRTDVEMLDPTLHQTTPSAISTAAIPKSTPAPVQPAPVAPPKPTGDYSGQMREVVVPSEPTPIRIQETVEDLESNTFRSTIIEPPKLQPSQQAQKSPQAETSTSTPKPPPYTMPNPVVEEDEEMPAIDMDSDSDIE